MKGQLKEVELSEGFGRTLLQLLVLLKKCKKIMPTGFTHQNLKAHLSQSIHIQTSCTRMSVQIYNETVNINTNLSNSVHF